MSATQGLGTSQFDKCLCSKCHCCTLCSSCCTDCPSKVKKSPDEELGQLLGVEMSSEEDTAAPQDSHRSCLNIFWVSRRVVCTVYTLNPRQPVFEIGSVVKD